MKEFEDAVDEPEGPSATEPRDLRLDETRSGRRVISAFIIVTLVSVIIAVPPESIAAPRSISNVSGEYLTKVGLYQGWSVFAPPRDEVLRLEARVKFADGTTTTWHLPVGNDIVGPYYDYHWQKFMEHAALRGNGDEWPRLREPLARYVASTVGAPRRRPVQVTLITERTTNLPIDSDGPTRAETRIDEYYTLDLDAPPKGS